MRDGVAVSRIDLYIFTHLLVFLRNQNLNGVPVDIYMSHGGIKATYIIISVISGIKDE
jgi:hypothetical protein